MAEENVRLNCVSCRDSVNGAAEQPKAKPSRGCIQIEKRSAVFFVQLMVTASAIGFSIFKLSTETECSHTTPYYILLTSSLSLWFPQPRYGD